MRLRQIRREKFSQLTTERLVADFEIPALNALALRGQTMPVGGGSQPACNPLRLEN